MSLLIKFTIGFTIVGFVVSLVFGFLGGNRVVSVLITTVICTLLSGALGAGTYKALEIKVPEFLAIFEPYGEGGEGYDDFEELGEDVDFGGEDAIPTAGSISGEGESSYSAQSSAAFKGDSQNFGDHVLVNKVKIKNEPKLMAEAIRTMLSRDES